MNQNFSSRIKAFIQNNTFFPAFSDGLLVGSQIKPIRGHSIFCLVFRHDMDNIHDAKQLTTFLEMDSALSTKSTCFFQCRSAISYADKLQQMHSLQYDVQLHSEARPRIIIALPHIEGAWLYFRYTRNLIAQKKEFENRTGIPIGGHSPHATNNYLYFNTVLNWSIIERATATANFLYLSDWQNPSRTNENEEFPEPLPPRWHVVNNNKKCLVFSTCWDDKFFFSSFKNRHIDKSHSDIYAHQSLESAFHSILNHIDVCRQKSMPFIINLHPCHFGNPNIPTYELKQNLISWARSNSVPILTLTELCHHINGNTEND